MSATQRFKEWGASQPHGKRARYCAGCRCEKCRKANTDKARELRRRNTPDPYTDPRRARSHILFLRRAGIGYRAIADASNLGRATVVSVLRFRRSGRKYIRTSTEQKILGVSPKAHSDGAFVPSDKSRKLIARLLEEGFTKTRIAREMGYANHALQLARSPYITARNEMRLKKFYDRYMKVAA